MMIRGRAAARVDSHPGGFALRPPLHALSLAASPARSVRVARPLRSLALTIFAFVAGTAGVAAQTAAVDVPVVFSTTPMTRNADAMLTVSILSTAALDKGLAELSSSLFRAPRPRGRLARTVKLALFDFPVVTYFASLNHEWGHQTSASEFGVSSRLMLVGTPWSPRQFRLEATSSVPEDPLAWPSRHGGGLEASRRLKDRAEARLRRVERVAPGYAIAAIAAALDAPMYAWQDLAPSRFNGAALAGDVNTLVFDLAYRRLHEETEELQQLRHDVRTRAALNLIDAALWTEVLGLVVDHVWNGEASVRVRWLPVAGLRLLPSVRYDWSPYGPEYYVGSQFKTSRMTGVAYFRWTERIIDDRQIGAGGSVTLPAISRTIAKRAHDIVPTIELDVWSHTAAGAGVHASIGAEISDWPSKRAALIATAGVKSRGHLIGYALDSGPYVTAGLNVRIW
jgi:hypothetical protein